MERPQGLNSPVLEHPSLVGHPTGTTAPALPDFGVIYTLFGTFTTQVSAPTASQPGDYFYPRLVGAAGWAAQNSPWTGTGSSNSPPGLFFFLWWKAGFWDFSGENKVLSWGV